MDEEYLYSWFDFRSYAFDDVVYNIQFLLLVGKKILQGSLNCPYSKELMKSIRMNGGRGYAG